MSGPQYLDCSRTLENAFITLSNAVLEHHDDANIIDGQRMADSALLADIAASVHEVAMHLVYQREQASSQPPAVAVTDPEYDARLVGLASQVEELRQRIRTFERKITTVVNDVQSQYQSSQGAVVPMSQTPMHGIEAVYSEMQGLARRIVAAEAEVAKASADRSVLRNDITELGARTQDVQGGLNRLVARMTLWKGGCPVEGGQFEERQSMRRFAGHGTVY